MTGRDVDQLAKLVEAYAENDALGNVDEVSDVGLRSESRCVIARAE